MLTLLFIHLRAGSASLSLTRFPEKHNTLRCSLGVIQGGIGIFEKNFSRSPNFLRVLSPHTLKFQGVR
jgi:hypothetical protein